jgi:hypothetical protein
MPFVFTGSPKGSRRNVLGKLSHDDRQLHREVATISIPKEDRGT